MCWRQFPDSNLNFLPNGIYLVQDLIIPKPQHSKANRIQPSCATFVVVFVFKMLATIDFYYESGFEACEVYYEGSQWDLPAKSEPKYLSIPEDIPQGSF